MAPCFLPWGANVWTQSVIIIVVVLKLGSFFPAFRLVVNGFSIYLYFVVLKMYKDFSSFYFILLFFFLFLYVNELDM